jgi:hypothetical protein
MPISSTPSARTDLGPVVVANAPDHRQDGSPTSKTMGTDVALARLLEFFETGTAPEGLFAPEVFLDLSLPQWRLQADNAADTIAARTGGHPFPGQVRVERLSYTDGGFVLEFEERWEHAGQNWYCREMLRAEVVGDAIVELAAYCTGDWDEATQRQHAQSVRLIRP